MESWIKFILPQQPITNINGVILNVAKRIVFAANPKKQTLGGEWVVPDLAGSNIISRHQMENLLLVRVDMALSDIQDLLMDDTSKYYPNTYSYGKKKSIGIANRIILSFQSFKPQSLSDATAEDIKQNVMGIFPIPEVAGDNKAT